MIDIQNPFKHSNDEEKMIIIYAVCIFSVCPLLASIPFYGWFNGNFRNEFTKTLRALLRMICCRNEGCLTSSQAIDNNTAVGATAKGAAGSLIFVFRCYSIIYAGF